MRWNFWVFAWALEWDSAHGSNQPESTKHIDDIQVTHASVSLNASDYNVCDLLVLRHVSQLDFFLEQSPWDQRVALHVEHHVPFNTFARPEFFQVG